MIQCTICKKEIVGDYTLVSWHNGIKEVSVKYCPSCKRKNRDIFRSYRIGGATVLKRYATTENEEKSR